MEIGTWLREARVQSGLALMEIAFRLRDELPKTWWVSTDTIRRIETKSDPDPVLVAALARVYGKAPDDWPQQLRDEIAKVRATIGATGRLLIHPNEGSTAGWPVCWWTAGGS